MRKTFVALPVLAGVSLVVACGSKPPNPPISVSLSLDGGTADAAPPPPADAGTDAGMMTGGPVFFTPDAGGPAPTASNSATPPPSTLPAMTDAAFDAAIDLAMTAASPKVAPKMEREGAAGRATLKEGEHFGMVVNLMPNRCYTVVGYSPPGSVAQLDVKLLAMPLNVQAGTSAAADKNMPVVGKGTAALCPILPVAVPYKIDVVATKGMGRIGVQVFARNK